MENNEAKELETRMLQMEVRKEQMKELCRNKDKDVFDVVYNVSGELKDINPTLEERLKERAIEGKRTDLDPKKTPAEKAENYSSLLIEIERLYSSAFSLMLENIKELSKQAAQKSAPYSKPLSVNTAFENANVAGTPMPEPEVAPAKEPEKKKGLFGGKKEPKEKKTATVERVSLDDLNNEKSKMDNENNNNDFDEERYRAYNENVKNRAESKEQSYESSGMQQERTMEKSAPSSSSKSDKK